MLLITIYIILIYIYIYIIINLFGITNNSEICNDIMWGREAKCKSCNMKCHVKCITEKIQECTKKPIDPEIAGKKTIHYSL